MNKKTFMTFLPYLIIQAAVFYAIPLIFMQTKDLSSANELLQLTILLINPITILTTHIIYARKKGLVMLSPIITGIVFTPCVFLCFSTSEIVYVFSYIALSYLAMLIGYASTRKQNKQT